MAALCVLLHAVIGHTARTIGTCARYCKRPLQYPSPQLQLQLHQRRRRRRRQNRLLPTILLFFVCTLAKIAPQAEGRNSNRIVCPATATAKMIQLHRSIVRRNAAFCGSYQIVPNILFRQWRQPRGCSSVATMPFIFTKFTALSNNGIGKNYRKKATPRRFYATGHKANMVIDDNENNNNTNKTNDEDSKNDKQKREIFLSSIRHSVHQDVFHHLFGLDDDRPNDDVIVNDNESLVKVEENQNNPRAVVILLAVSGGCDSIGLLHVMLHLMDRQITTNTTNGADFLFNSLDDRERAKISPGSNSSSRSASILCKLHVVHFDHQQRGLESDGDRLFVQELCQKLQLPFHCYYWEDQDQAATIAAASEDTHGKKQRPTKQAFSQEIARDWRRSKASALLQSLLFASSSSNDEQHNKYLSKHHQGAILTAHHKDDSNETLLLKLLRGTHITNLSGMKPLSSSPANRYEPDSETKTLSLFAKPMLDVTKDQVTHFLKSQGITWREDASNASTKYKRNRVRNELIPLLADLAGGEKVLQKRLDNLSEQSQEIQEDLSLRANTYLEESNNGQHPFNDDCFVLPKYEMSLDLVKKQALISWANRCMAGQSFSYDQLGRVCKQLTDYPNRRVWTLSLGGGWDLVRKGDTLQLKGQQHKGKAGAGAVGNTNTKSSDNARNDIENGERQITEGKLAIQIPARLVMEINQNKQTFIRSNVSDKPNLKFVPPWRRNRSPLKMKDFLRGQKVPLHRRSCASVLLLEDESSLITHVVAVFIEGDHDGRGSSRKWVVHSDFHAENDQVDGTQAELYFTTGPTVGVNCISITTTNSNINSP